MDFPGWLRDLVHKLGGHERDLRFIMTKSITTTDMHFKQENRLLIPSKYVRANLIPMLFEHEKAAASLPARPKAGRNTPSTSRVQGREHGGLEVRVYTRSGFCSYLILTCWDSGSTVIKGSDYKNLLNWSSFRENDVVEMWGFRHGDGGKLCFALSKKEQ